MGGEPEAESTVAPKSEAQELTLEVTASFAAVASLLFALTQ